MQATLPALFHLYTQHLPRPPEKEENGPPRCARRVPVRVEALPQAVDEWEPRAGGGAGAAGGRGRARGDA